MAAHQKGFTHILIILIILVLGGAAFWGYKSLPSKTQNASSASQPVNTINNGQSPSAAENNKTSGIIIQAVSAKGVDPKTGAAVNPTDTFLKAEKSIYVVLSLNDAKPGTKLAYVRYLNSKYLDHGSLTLKNDASKYASFIFSLKNETSNHFAASYKVRLYANGVFAKEIRYYVVYPSSAALIVPQTVLGAALSPCQSGGLSTSINHISQGTYTNEDFQQLQNIDALKDVSQLNGLTCLQYLDGTDRNLKGDIGGLKNLTNLELFSLYENPEVTGDICTLAGATKLRDLKFAFDPKITGNISCLKNLTNLETFAMTYAQLSGDLSVFADMPNLKALYISGTNIKGDICSLKNLTNMEELGISNQYPGNKGITGDLSCLSNMKKLNKVSLYSTSTTNCDQFTKDHPDIEQGGCSLESLKTLVVHNAPAEAKIGKEVYTSGAPYLGPSITPASSGPKGELGSSGNRGFLGGLIMAIRGFLGHLPMVGGIFGGPGPQNGVEPQGGPGFDNNGPALGGSGPGGCKSKAECEAFCSKKENQDVCAKFAPEGPAPSDMNKGGPGGCKTAEECQAYCVKREHWDECEHFKAPE